MQDIFNKVIISVFSSLGTGLAAYLTALITRLVNEKIQTSKDNRILKSINNIIEDVVKLLYQTDVEALKKNNTFTEEAQKKIKDKAIQLISCQITSTMKEYIEKNSKDLNQYISDKIEASIYTLKSQLKK